MDTTESRTVPPFKDKEKARQGGLKGGAAFRAKMAKAKEDPLFLARDALPGLFNDLLRAAKGSGTWKTLPKEKRLVAILKLIEYGVGRPETMSKAKVDQDVQAQDEQEGLTIA
mgnify:CR=1 FL=1